MIKKSKTKKINGVRKIENAFLNFITLENTQKEIKKLRLKFEIPEDGFSNFNYRDLILANEIIYTPKEWIFHTEKIDLKFKQINLAVKKFAEKMPELNFGISIFRFYLFHNVVPHEVFDWFLETTNVCKLSETSNLSHINNKEIKLIEKENTIYPITVKISPNATQRDIINFISQNWNDIQWLQKKYTNPLNKIGKFKTRNERKREIYDFVYKNRYKYNSKDMLKILYEKYGTALEIDQGLIGKIISLEKERRK